MKVMKRSINRIKWELRRKRGFFNKAFFVLWNIIRILLIIVWTIVKWLFIAIVEVIFDDINSPKGSSITDIDCYKKEVDYQYFYGQNNSTRREFR